MSFEILACVDKDWGVHEVGIEFIRTKGFNNYLILTNIALDKCLSLGKGLDVVYIKDQLIDVGIKQCLDKLDKKVLVYGDSALFTYFLNSVLLTKCHIYPVLSDNASTPAMGSINRELLRSKCYLENPFDEHQKAWLPHARYVGEDQYLAMLFKVLITGYRRDTRNAVTRSIFAGQMSFDLKQGFPLLTTRKMYIRGIFEELKFFMIGDTNTNHLMEKNVNIWTQNTNATFLKQVGLDYPEGYMGPMYGYQLRYFNAPYSVSISDSDVGLDLVGLGVDQLAKCIDLLKRDPASRRIIMTTLNPAQAEEGVLYPCHGIVIQFHVGENGELDCHMYQRSMDFLGCSWNISSYALLTILMTHIINNDLEYHGQRLTAGTLTMSFGDCHIYENNLESFKTQLSRLSLKQPKLEVKTSAQDFKDINWSDIQLLEYESHAPIKFEMTP